MSIYEHELHNWLWVQVDTIIKAQRTQTVPKKFPRIQTPIKNRTSLFQNLNSKKGFKKKLLTRRGPSYNI